MQSVDSNNGKTFWKKNSKSLPGSIKAVYGAMHPPIGISPKDSPKKEPASGRKDGTNDSFQNFQASVNDAWDCEDDEFSVISDVKISNKMSKSAALDVIHSHRTSLSNPVSTSINETSPTIASTNVVEPENFPTPIRSHTSFKKQHAIASAVIERDLSREEKFEELLQADKTNLGDLRKVSWSGIPPTMRPDVWRLLCGYLPANAERREETLKRKRNEYWSYVNQYYDTRHDDLHQDTYRQIHIDIPRMSPLMPIFQQSLVQEIFERILYIWAIRHPASGYVQGINDLVTPFFVVFLYEFVPGAHTLTDAVRDNYDVSLISPEGRALVEADSFWCMNKLMDGIQDNYTFAQPGIQTRVNQLRELIKRIDITLHKHLERNEIDYLQFSFRWFNNLLMREIPLGRIIRLWDTLHAEPNGFSHFVLYVCAAFLTHFSSQLLDQKEFQTLMLLLQNLPTDHWTDNDISVIVAEAFRLKYVFADAPKHLQESQ